MLIDPAGGSAATFVDTVAGHGALATLHCSAQRCTLGVVKFLEAVSAGRRRQRFGSSPLEPPATFPPLLSLRTPTTPLMRGLQRLQLRLLQQGAAGEALAAVAGGEAAAARALARTLATGSARSFAVVARQACRPAGLSFAAASVSRGCEVGKQQGLLFHLRRAANYCSNHNHSPSSCCHPAAAEGVHPAVWLCGVGPEGRLPVRRPPRRRQCGRCAQAPGGPWRVEPGGGSCCWAPPEEQHRARVPLAPQCSRGGSGMCVGDGR